MKYTWDYNELRNRRDALINLYNNSNISDKKEIGIVISTYDILLHSISENRNVNRNRKGLDNSILYDSTIRDENLDELIMDFSYFYEKKYIPILNFILPTWDIIKDFDFKCKGFRIASTNEELIKVTLDFFKVMTTPHIYNQVKEVFKNDKNFLNIIYSKAYNPNPGITIVDSILKKEYISIARANTIFDYTVLPHQLFHYIYADYDLKTLVNHNAFLLSEVEGMFADILFSEFYNKYFDHTKTQDSELLKKFSLSVFKEELTGLVVRNGILECIGENNKIRLHKLNKYNSFFKIPTVDKLNDLIPYLDTPQEELMTYSLSYLVALDLYQIYKRDREYAFYLIKCIRFLKEEDNIKSLLIRNEITFFQDNYKNLKEYIQAILSRVLIHFIGNCGNNGIKQ